MANPPIPTREEQANREIGVTDIAPRLAWTLIVVSLVTICLDPALRQFGLKVPAGANATEHSEDAAPLGPASVAREFARLIPGGTDLATVRGPFSFRDAMPSAPELKDFESFLEDGSPVGQRLFGATQLALTKFLGVGNEQVYAGRDGWLFYRPGMDYLIGPGFLEPNALGARAKSGDEWSDPPQPDPLAAIIDLDRQLDARDIDLILVPAPTKAMLHPEKFSSRFEDRPADAPGLQNASWPDFSAALRDKGITVFATAAVLGDALEETGEDQYLISDSHWTPLAVDTVAEALASLINERFALDSTRQASADDATVTSTGDVRRMLKLPEGADFLPAQTVTVHPISHDREQNDTNSEEPSVEPSAQSDVLLLGDSFANIYSLAGMGWGESAGLAEQLAWHLGSPVEAIRMNDNGAYATRAELARRMTRGDDPLRGKKVVVWEFAIRELAVGDWKMIDLPDVVPGEPGSNSTRADPPGSTDATTDGWIEITATIRAATRPPQPGSVPYKDCVIAYHLGGVRAEDPAVEIEGEIVVLLWGMRDDEWTAEARPESGASVQMRLKPWAEVQSEYSGYTRVEFDDMDLLLLDTFWGEPIQ